MAVPRQFPTSYQASREEFLDHLSLIQERWPGARLETRSVSEEEDLSIDWIAADATEKRQKALIITCGLHGVEGFVGSRMTSLFIDEFLEQIDPGQTGLYLVHAINPWGMHHKRRVTRNNVDLNRNFAFNESDFQEAINPDYALFDSMLNPDRRLNPLWQELPRVIGSVIVNLLRTSVKSFRNAVLQGQRSNPYGIYFSGNDYEPETQSMMELLKEIFAAYQDTMLIDLHTGYGPKYQMCLVNSPEEGRDADQLIEDFQYPLARKANPEQFYTMQGDMVDWTYKYRESAGLKGEYYAAAFEFGTIGDTIPHEIISLWNMIFENQYYRKGAITQQTETKIKDIFWEMFSPSEKKWREKALADCRRAFRGVLGHEGYLG